jgi:hypothetical protein
MFLAVFVVDVSSPLPAVVTDDDAAVLTSLVVAAGNDFRSIILQRDRSRTS